MKKLYIFALVAMLFAACTTDEAQDVAVNIETPDTLTVSFEGDDSRIQLQEGKTVWTEGDFMSVFYRSNANQKWQYQGETGERSGTIKRVTNATATQELSNIVIVYPYNANYYINPRSFNVQAFLPAQQTYLKDSYGLDGNIMISSSEYKQFSLKNVCGWLKIQLTGNGERVKSIKLKGNNGEQVAGEIYINSEDASCELAADAGAFGDDTEVGGTIFEDGSVLTSVTLYCRSSVELSSEPTAFYIALPPQTFKNGISIEITDAYGTTITKSTDKEVEIKRNTILPMAAFEVEMEQKVIANTEIWYTNGSTTDATTPRNEGAFGANIVSNTYDAEKECWVIKFDSAITSIGNTAFDNCTSLTSVTIPDSVTSIGSRAFSRCTSLTSITIPDSVTSIGGYAFRDCTSLTSITIPDSVTSIGDNAFKSCTSLTSVTIPNSVTSIGDWAFFDCTSLTSITIGNSVASIGSAAFYGCTSLTSVTIPDRVTAIGSSAFNGCTSLTSVTIPDSVTSIGDYAFANCTSLTRVDITDLSAWCKISFGDFGATPLFYAAKLYLNGSELTNITIPSDITEIKSSAFSGCKSLTSVTIPDSVTSIGDDAFHRCKSLTSVTIGNSVTSIGDDAFEECTSLTSITIPDSVTSIGERAFYNCRSLTSITIPESVISIENNAFTDCTGELVLNCNCLGLFGGQFSKVIIGESVTSIGDRAFCECTSLTSVIIGNGVTSIGDAAFYNCTSLTSITIPDSVTSIGYEAFYKCISLTSITIPESVTSIGNNAFTDCTGELVLNCNCLGLFGGQFSKVIIGESVTSIGNAAFDECTSLTSVTIPDSVTSIGDWAFSDCKQLTSVTIGRGVTSIGDWAFFDCISLKVVYCKPENPPTLGSHVFSYPSEDNTDAYPICCTYYVPHGSVPLYNGEYQPDSDWRTYADYIEGYNF